MVIWVIPGNRQDKLVGPICRTSDFIGFTGFRVLIREFPPNGGFDSGRRGTQFFRLAYRPVEERGKTTLRFRNSCGHPVRMARASAIIPSDEPFEISYLEADGKIASFEIHPAFFAEVVDRAGISPVKLLRLPPAGFLAPNVGESYWKSAAPDARDLRYSEGRPDHGMF